MEGKVKHKNNDRKGEIIDSKWLHNAKRKDYDIINYRNVEAVEWEDGGFSWTNIKLLEEI